MNTKYTTFSHLLHKISIAQKYSNLLYLLSCPDTNWNTGGLAILIFLSATFQTQEWRNKWKSEFTKSSYTITACSKTKSKSLE